MTSPAASPPSRQRLLGFLASNIVALPQRDRSTAIERSQATMDEQDSDAGAVLPAPERPPLKAPQILVLGRDRLRTAYHWTSEVAQNVEAVAYVQFDHPTAGVVDAYAKFYDLGGRGMVNEVTGYLLARAYGLPVPGCAFIAMVPLDSLPTPLEGVAAIAKQSGNDCYPAFCTQDVSSTGVQPLIDTEALRAELLRWKPLTECVAFDEHSANADRHCRNLVRRALRDFVLIDHGRLAWRFNEPRWTAPTLDPLGEYDNRLSHFLWDHEPESRIASAVMASANAHSQKLPETIEELRHWWDALVPDERDARAWETFIVERLANAEALVRKRYGLLT